MTDDTLALIVIIPFLWALLDFWPLHPLCKRIREARAVSVHPFKQHIRRDTGLPVSWCDVCNKSKRHRSHRVSKLDIAGSIEELERWHHEWRLKHDRDYATIHNDSDELLD